MVNKLSNDFWWGGSISAHQSEGFWQTDGKGINFMDLVTSGSYKSPRQITDEIVEGNIYPSHTGIGFYQYYKEDIKQFAEMGFTALRISIDWSRIFPTGEEEKPNKEGLNYYHDLIDTLLEYHITPIVTLYHFEMPMHLVKKYGSWKNRELIKFYLKFCETLYTSFKGKVKNWVTFNEMNHLDPQTELADIFTYLLTGIKYSDLTDKKQELADMGYYMTLASVKAVELGKKIDPENKIGCVFGLTPMYSYDCHPENVMNSFKDMERDFYQIDAMCQGQFPKYKLHEYEKLGITLTITEEDKESFKKGVIDFIGINYYCSGVSTPADFVGESAEAMFGGIQNPYLEKSKWGWAIDPVGLRYLMNYTYRKYQKPVLITENGLGAQDVVEENKIHDEYRIDYLKQHIQSVKAAVLEDGVECLGYLTWAPIDLVSATTGEMKKRYGFIYVNKQDNGTGDYKRIRKDSFYWYQKVIQSNGENL